jgi:hypothetical protein
MSSGDVEKEILKGERRQLCSLHSLRLAQMDKKVDSLETAIYGNGHPEEGILWIAKKNNETLNWVAKVCVWILAIVGSGVIIKIYPEILHFMSGKP